MKKGGHLLPKNGQELFMEYFNNSKIKYISKGTDGIICVLRLKEDVKLSEHYKLLSPDENYGKPLKEHILMKIVAIEPDKNRYGDRFLIDPSTEKEFQNEVNVQTDIFLKTVTYLQPLCPGIVYADIIKNKEDIVNILKYMENNETILYGGFFEPDISAYSIYKSFFPDSGKIIHMGIIGMQYLSRSVAKTLYNDYSPININIGRFALLQLALQTGYTQNDFHTNNIMLIKDDNYFDDESKKRPMIIDFGRSIKIPPDVMKEIIEHVDKKEYTKALTLLCDKRIKNSFVTDIQYSQYGWICGDYNMSSEDYKKEIETRVKEKRQPINPKNFDSIAAEIPKPKPHDESINEVIQGLFEQRENAIDNVIKKMDQLHRENKEYPLLPISNEIKNKLYNGMIGGGRKILRRRKTLKKKSGKRSVTNRNL